MRYIIGNKNLRLMKYSLIVLVTFLVGCSVADGPVYYVKSKDKHKILKHEYNQMDTLHLKYYSFGAWNEKSTFGDRMGHQLDYSHDTVWNNIIDALKKTNIPLQVSQTPYFFEIPEWYTINKNPDVLKEKILRARQLDDSSRIVIVPIIGYYSAWKAEINAGLTGGSISPSDRLEHSLYYDVDLYVLSKNELIYRCRALKVDTLTRDPSEPYRYHFPQELWDTLMYMSTRDYVERMR
jgi:hypothetical protein